MVVCFCIITGVGIARMPRLMVDWKSIIKSRDFILRFTRPFDIIFKKALLP